MSQLHKNSNVLSEEAHEKMGADVNIEGVGEGASGELDAAGKFLADMAAGPDGEYLVSPYTEEESRAVRRKADLIVCPLLFWALS